VDKRQLTPVGFKYCLQHFVMGSMNFFRKPEYVKFAKTLPQKSHSSYVMPLGISLLEPTPWRRVGDMSTLMMNWDGDKSIPFFQNSWWGPQESTPPWPYKYNNKAPSC